MVIRKEGYNIIAQPERNVQHRACLNQHALNTTSAQNNKSKGVYTTLSGTRSSEKVERLEQPHQI